MTDIPVVLDASALQAYADGRLAVGELIAEVADEGRRVGIPAVCLAHAYAATGDDAAAAHLMLLTTTAVAILPLAADEPGRADEARQVGRFAAAAGGDLSIGYAVRAALHHEAYYATTQPARVARILPSGWEILDLSR